MNSTAAGSGHQTAQGGRRDAATDPSSAVKILLWFLLILIAGAALYEFKPPVALDASTPPEQFSSARAMEHVRQIAQRPHFIGTGENHRVRDYLVQQLRGLGAEVHVESTTGVLGWGRNVVGATVQNIVATFPGSANERAVMFASHYDSVERAPGAGDDASGVATILETVRAIKVGQPLKNDVLVVFTDGEESGLLGAAGFAADHPDLAKRVGIVLNFDSRGSSGPGLMFEMSEENGWLVQQFSQIAPYPMASSLMYTAYKLLPNDTDMTIFKRAGLAGMNFGFIGGYQDYHTRLDTPENLDPRSLQHLGSYALNLSRRFGNLDLRDLRQPDRVYFNWLGSHLIQYRYWVVWALLPTILVLFIAVFIRASRRQLITPLRIAAAFGGFLLLVLAVLVASHLAWGAVSGFVAGGLQIGDTPANELFLACMLLTGTAFAAFVQSLLVSRLGWVNAALGGLLGFALVTAIVAVQFPGASFAFEWPLVFALGGLLLAVRAGRQASAAALGWLGSGPAILIFAPLIYLILVLLDLNAISVTVVAILLALFLSVASPLFVHLANPWRWTVPILLAGAIVCFLFGKHLSPFSAQHPRPDTVFYCMDADQHKAVWLSYDPAPDAWTTQFLGTQPRKGREPAFTVGGDFIVLAKDAPALALEPPAAQVTSDKFENGIRALKLHFTSPRGANSVMIRLPAEASIRSVAWNGREQQITGAAASHSSWYLRYFAVPPEGVDLELQLTSKEPVKCWVGDRSLGLPQLPGQSFLPRPQDAMAWYGSDVTLVGRQYSF